ADQKLMALSMRVLAAHVFPRRFEDDKVALGYERNLAGKLTYREAAAQILEDRQSMNHNARHRGFFDVRFVGDRGFWRDACSALGVDVADNAGRVAGHNRARWNVVRDHGTDADHRARANAQPRENRCPPADRRVAPDVSFFDL